MAQPTSSTPFALGTFAHEGGDPFPGLVLGDRALDLRADLGASSSIRSMLDAWDVALPAAQAVADRGLAGRDSVALADLRPLPPVLPVGQVFQSGANYRKHVLDLFTAAERRGDSSDGMSPEMRESARRQLDERARHGRPFVFLGSSHPMIGAEDDVVLPADGEQHDWELELAAVIGRPGRRLTRERALDVVAGYTICNDVTTRDALNRPDSSTLGLDWLAGKNAPTFLPTGPLLVPAVHAGDPMDLHIRLSVNGRTMQDETTADMLFDLASILEHISTVSELRPGDLVLTGSPAGNGASHGVFLAPGDIMEGEITGLGIQRNSCVAEPLSSAAERVSGALLEK
jgi:2-keto-4-pentenoate hydratase/2-oxohepta-3-ene-1,7-dioic acid hydratase in catechol pathway